MIEFTYSINSHAVDKLLAGFRDALADQRSALERIAADARQMIARQFATEGQAEGTPWPALALATLRRQRAGGSILYSSGALLRSLVGSGGEGHVEELEDHALTFGSRLPYALFHQTGTRRLPARPLIVLSDPRAAKWAGFIRSAIARDITLLGAKELGGKL